MCIRDSRHAFFCQAFLQQSFGRFEVRGVVDQVASCGIERTGNAVRTLYSIRRKAVGRLRIVHHDVFHEAGDVNAHGQGLAHLGVAEARLGDVVLKVPHAAVEMCIRDSSFSRLITWL